MVWIITKYQGKRKQRGGDCNVPVILLLHRFWLKDKLSTQGAADHTGIVALLESLEVVSKAVIALRTGQAMLTWNQQLWVMITVLAKWQRLKISVGYKLLSYLWCLLNPVL